jgi:16S rRNA (uracil1498-N3)-methyltransferase
VNLLLVQPAELGGEQLMVRGRRAAHVHGVLKAQPGDRIKIGVVRESVGSAQVLSSSSESLLLGDLQMQPAGPGPMLRLVIALPRPKALRRLLQTAASFQVAHIDIVNAWRVQKSYWDSPSVQPDALETELLLGCEQGRHVWLPTIRCHRLFMPFVTSFSESPPPGPRLVAHPGSPSWLRDVDTSTGAATIAVGPEGGWIAKEIASLEQSGFQKVSISKAILRSEIALAAILAQWELLTS